MPVGVPGDARLDPGGLQRGVRIASQGCLCVSLTPVDGSALGAGTPQLFDPYGDDILGDEVALKD